MSRLVSDVLLYWINTITNERLILKKNYKKSKRRQYCFPQNESKVYTSYKQLILRNQKFL